MTSSPARYPAFPIAADDKVQRRLGRRQIGREAAFVADIGVVAGGLSAALQRVEDFGARAQAPRQRTGRRRGTIMNSWKSIGLSACTPPLMMFIIGTGKSRAAAPPT